MTFSKNREIEIKEGHHDCQVSSEKNEPPITINVGSISGKTLDTQIAGHKNGMIDLGDGTVLKSLQKPPRSTTELNFYETVFDKSSSDSDYVELRQFLAPYFGSEEINETVYVKLKNLTSGYKHPCVADIKMGKVTYDKDATPEKMESEMSKWPPMLNIGFRFCGMMVFDPKTEKSESFGKKFSLNLDENDIVTNGLGRYFGLYNGNLRRDVIRTLLVKLEKLKKWFEHQKKFSFVASSLLLIYEGEDDNLDCSRHETTSGVTDEQSVKDSLNPGDENKSLKRKMNSSVSDIKEQGDGKSLYSEATRECMTDVEESSQKKVKLVGSFNQNQSSYTSTECLEKDNQSEVREVGKSSLADVRLIDFAHVFPAEDIDENYLFGLNNLIKFLRELLSMDATPSNPV